MPNPIHGSSSNQNHHVQPSSFPFNSGSKDLDNFQKTLLNIDNGFFQLDQDLKAKARKEIIKKDIGDLKANLDAISIDFAGKGGDALELHYHTPTILKINDYLTTLNKLDLSVDNPNLQEDIEKAYPTVETLEGLLMNNFHQ